MNIYVGSCVLVCINSIVCMYIKMHISTTLSDIYGILKGCLLSFFHLVVNKLISNNVQSSFLY